jgi:hypothetical protein
MIFLALFSGFSSVGSGSVRNISLYSKFFILANRARHPGNASDEWFAADYSFYFGKQA